MNAEKVSALIHQLDLIDPKDVGAWRTPVGVLWEELRRAQRVRRWVATPVLAAVIAVPGLIGVQQWEMWLVATAIMGATAFFLMQTLLEALAPILAREERVVVLCQILRGYRDYDDDDRRGTDNVA